MLDGSTHVADQERNRDLVEAIGPRAAYVGARQREAIVGRLAGGGVDPKLLQLALGGGTIGSQRNLLLILTAGRGVLMTDDDIRWAAWRPSAHRPGLALAGHTEAREHRFFASRDEAVADCGQESGNLLALHEAVLGRPVRDLIDGDTDLSQACAHLLDALHSPPSPIVRVSMAGLAGDAGTYCPHLRLLAEGSLKAALAADEAAFTLALSSREIQRIARQTLVTHEPRCMAGCMALDNREVTPPFMWRGSNEDGVFGMMLGAVDRRALFAHLAHGVIHASTRPSVRDSGPIVSAAQTRLADLLPMIATRVAGSPAPDVPTGLASVARRCRELGCLRLEEFRDQARAWLLEARSRQLLRLAEIADDGSYPEYWRAAARHYRGACLASLQDPWFYCPVEFRQPGRPIGDCFEEARAFTRAFGELLDIWPALWARARQLGSDALLGA